MPCPICADCDGPYPGPPRSVIKEPEEMTYTADKRLWATVDGKVVEDGDPRAAVLIATPGSEMSDEDAARYGLKTAGEKAVKAPPENKQINQPPSNKRR